MMLLGSSDVGKKGFISSASNSIEYLCALLSKAFFKTIKNQQIGLGTVLELILNVNRTKWEK